MALIWGALSPIKYKTGRRIAGGDLVSAAVEWREQSRVCDALQEAAFTVQQGLAN